MFRILGMPRLVNIPKIRIILGVPAILGVRGTLSILRIMGGGAGPEFLEIREAMELLEFFDFSLVGILRILRFLGMQGRGGGRPIILRICRILGTLGSLTPLRILRILRSLRCPGILRIQTKKRTRQRLDGSRDTASLTRAPPGGFAPCSHAQREVKVCVGGKQHEDSKHCSNTLQVATCNHRHTPVPIA